MKCVFEHLIDEVWTEIEESVQQMNGKRLFYIGEVVQPALCIQFVMEWPQLSIDKVLGIQKDVEFTHVRGSIGPVELICSSYIGDGQF